MTDPQTTTEAKSGGGRESRRVLVIDTDPGVLWALEKGLANSGYTVRTASTAEQAVYLARQEEFSGIVMEIMPEAGLTAEVLERLTQSPGRPKVLCSAIDSAPQTVVECMRRGATDFLLKPFSLGEVRSALAKVLAGDLDGAGAGDGGGETEGHEASLLVGVSRAMQELRTTIKQVAQTDLNCLLRGESGVGKDLVAREIHRLSSRCDQPFIKVNCGALPDQLLESELFGFEKGAFTGAVTSKPGRFTLADRGVIFLDEIAEIHPSVQAKLLQVIEHKEFTKLGGRGPVKVDVQIVAATNADIEQRTQDQRFRQDLLFRLNEVDIWVPPLSARTEDIPVLVRHFARKYDHFTAGVPYEFTGEELAMLCEQEWPGNVRELESTVKRWLVLGTHALPEQKPPEFRQNFPPETGKAKAGEAGPEGILKVLEKHRWNRRKAAEELGISYQALRRRIEKFKLKEHR